MFTSYPDYCASCGGPCRLNPFGQLDGEQFEPFTSLFSLLFGTTDEAEESKPVFAKGDKVKITVEGIVQGSNNASGWYTIKTPEGHYEAFKVGSDDYQVERIHDFLPVQVGDFLTDADGNTFSGMGYRDWLGTKSVIIYDKMGNAVGPDALRERPGLRLLSRVGEPVTA
jgi:hypothetical protein